MLGARAPPVIDSFFSSTVEGDEHAVWGVIAGANAAGLVERLRDCVHKVLPTEPLGLQETGRAESLLLAISNGPQHQGGVGRLLGPAVMRAVVGAGEQAHAWTSRRVRMRPHPHPSARCVTLS